MARFKASSTVSTGPVYHSTKVPAPQLIHKTYRKSNLANKYLRSTLRAPSLRISSPKDYTSTRVLPTHFWKMVMHTTVSAQPID